MSRISLLRHGATAAGARYCGTTDVPLSEAGWQQLWQAVDGKRWTRIVSSPLQRCAAFAQALAEAQQISCAIDLRWRELHFGDWEGASAAELFERSPLAIENFWRDPLSFPAPNSEPLPALQHRVLEAWKTLTASIDMSTDDETILVVTHGGPIRVVLAERDGIALRDLLKIEVAHAQLFELQTSAACVPS